MPAIFVADVPACGPRVKPEGQEYQMRNRGSMSNYLDHSKNRNFTSPRPMPRTGGNPEAAEQMQKARGSMNTLFDEQRNKSYASPRRPPRCNTPDAQFQYERAKGCMNEVLAGHGSKDPRNRGPFQARGVRPEAADIANANKGTGTKKLFETYGKVTARAPPMARVKPEAEDIAMNSKGNATKALFHNYGKQSGDCPRASLAITDESSGNAELGRGGRAKKLLSMEVPSSR